MKLPEFLVQTATNNPSVTRDDLLRFEGAYRAGAALKGTDEFPTEQSLTGWFDAFEDWTTLMANAEAPP